MRCAVIGAGVMGSGIAQTLAQAGHDVWCRDVAQERLDAAAVETWTGRFGMDRAVARGKLTREQADEARERLRFTLDLQEALSDADVVVEAVPEDLGLKIALAREIDDLAPAHAILATNTSGYPILAVASATQRPEQVIGWHWASPAVVRPLAEIITTKHTSEATRDAIVTLAAECGKNPIVVKDHPMAWGFVANRIYVAAMLEAQRVVQDGVATPAEVDQLMKDCFAWPLGPYEMMGIAEANVASATQK